MLNGLSDWTAYLKQQKIGVSGNKLLHKGKRVGTLQIIDEDDFVIQVFTQFDSFFFELLADKSDAIKSRAEQQISANNCPRCIDGKCAVTGIRLKPRDEETEAFAKSLLALRCEAIDKERVPKCNYVKLTDRDKRPPCRKCKKCNPACRALRNF